MPRPHGTERRLSGPTRNKVDARRPSTESRVAELAAESGGVLSIEELAGCGLSRLAVARRETRGLVHRRHQGVYAIGHTAISREAEWLAAVKACRPHGILSHYSAAAHWGFVEWDDRKPEVTVPGPGTRCHAGIRVHRSKTLERRDWLTRNGIPVTSPARTLLDLASQLSYNPLRRAVREAMADRRVDVRQLVDILARTGPRRGCRKLARIVAEGDAPTRSVLEDAVLDLIIAGGFERPDVGVPITVDGRRFVPDFRWPEQRIIVEADGARWHDHELAREDDAERQALLEANGEHVIRVTWRQAVTKQHQTLRRLGSAGAPVRRAST